MAFKPDCTKDSATASVCNLVFTKTIFENNEVKAEGSLAQFLPLDSLEKAAIASINEKAGTSFKKSEKVEIKLSNGSIVFYFKDAYSIQVNGENGYPILIEKKFGGIIQDIHDGAILDSWINNKKSSFKKSYSLIMGISLLILTITGTYLWFKPIIIKRDRG